MDLQNGEDPVESLYGAIKHEKGDLNMTHPNINFNAFEGSIQLFATQGPEALAEATRDFLMGKDPVSRLFYYWRGE